MVFFSDCFTQKLLLQISNIDIALTLLVACFCITELDERVMVYTI